MKVFISFDHARNQEHKDYISDLLERINNSRKLSLKDISIDEENKIDDDGLSDEQIREKIRDDYLKDSDITIVIVGSDTKNRKFIDWEVYSTVRDYSRPNDRGTTYGNVIVVNCCTFPGEEKCRSWILDKELIMKYDGSCNRSWNNATKSSIHEKFCFLPDRLLNSMADNFDNEVNKTIENGMPNTKVHDYPHAVFPIIGFDRLQCDNGDEVLSLALRQAQKYIEINKGKWDLSKLRRRNNESADRETFQQIEL